MHHCSSHEPERYFSIRFSPCPTPGITCAVWHQTARQHTVHWACSCVTCYRLTRSLTIAWWCTVESPCAGLPPCLITHFSTIVSALCDCLAGKSLSPSTFPALCIATQFQSLNVFCALRDFLFFYWKSTLILCWVILCYTYCTLQVLSQLIMNMKTLLYHERAFSCMMHVMLLLMICTSCYIIFTHYLLYPITLDTWHVFRSSISWK